MITLQQIFALLGIMFLLLAGLCDFTNNGGWKLLVLAIGYAILNAVIFIVP